MGKKLVFLSVNSPGIGLHERVFISSGSLEEITEKNAAHGFAGPCTVAKTVPVFSFDEFVTRHCNGVIKKPLAAWEPTELNEVLNAPARLIFSVIPTEPERYIAPGMHMLASAEFYVADVPWDPAKPEVFSTC